MFDDPVYGQMTWMLARLVIFLLAIGLGKSALRNLRDEICWLEAPATLSLVLLLLCAGYIAWSLYEVTLATNTSLIGFLVGLLVIGILIRNLLQALVG
jgi:hypothetical protein